MSKWFEEDKVYRFKAGYKDIFNETCGANKRIAQFIGENSFKVKIDPAKNVISIKREIDDCWYKAVDVMLLNCKSFISALSIIKECWHVKEKLTVS